MATPRNDTGSDRWRFTFEIEVPYSVDPATLAGQMGHAAHKAGGLVLSAKGDQQQPGATVDCCPRCGDGSGSR